MKKTLRLILGLILLTALALTAFGCGSASEQSAENTQDAQTDQETSAPTQSEPLYAPDFTVTDREGNEVRFSDRLGKPVILNLWASWCPPCRAELPDFDAAYQAYGDQIDFMMIDLCDGRSETPATGAAFVDQEGYIFPVYFDTTGSAASVYQAYAIPMTIGVKENGEIAGVYNGALSGEQVNALVNNLLS